MTLRGRALIIAVALGAVAQVAISLVSIYLTRDFPGNVLALLAISGNPSRLSLLACAVGIGIDMFTGVFCAYLHILRSSLSVGHGALAGGLAAAVSRLVSTWALFLFWMSRQSTDVGYEAILLIGYGLYASIPAIGLGAVFGAVGGFLGSVLMKGESPVPN